MELNRDRIVKELEYFHQRILDTDLAKNIYEAEITAIIDALALIRELTEENDGLRDKLTETEIPFEQALDRVKWLEIKIESLKADIVRKMQERLNQVFGNAGVTGVLLCQIFDQVAKELLEENT